MTFRRYQTFIESFCQEFGLPDSASILRGGFIDFGNALFSIRYYEDLNPEFLIVQGDFGAPNPHKSSEAYILMLQKNLQFGPPDGPTFAITPDTGRVVLLQRMPLQDMTPHSFADRLAGLASRIQSCRQELKAAKRDRASKIRPPKKISSTVASLAHR
jgi:hypothetical protein